MRKTTMLIAFLFTLVVLPPHLISAQPATDLSVCNYQETRENIPMNPKTNKPYTPDERNQEPFTEASITKDAIRQCLQAKKPIENHHVVFEDYRDAWQEMAKETGDYAIPLLIQGGVLHANQLYDAEKKTGGIHLGEFRDPTVKDASVFTDEQRKAFGVEKQDTPIALIHAEIKWESVFIDSIFFIGVNNEKEQVYIRIILRGLSDFIGAIFSEKADFSRVIFSETADFRGNTFSKVAAFSDATFNKTAAFSGATFSKGAYFSGSTFKRAAFIGANFSEVSDFRWGIFSEVAYFGKATFSELSDFSGATFSEGAYFFESTFSKGATFFESTFSKGATFSEATFSKTAAFSEATFSKTADFSRTTFSEGADFSRTTFSEGADFSRTRFKDNADFREMLATDILIFDGTTWEKRLDFRGMSAKELHWDSTHNPSTVQGVIDLREAWVGSATFKEVRCQDLVDFSRTTFGQYKVEIVGPPTQEQHQKGQEFLWTLLSHTTPFIRFENNTFQNEVDLLHVTFDSPVLFINNRFRSTLDLTGATFVATNDAQKDHTSPLASREHHLCLSYNRIQRLVLESKYLGEPSRFSPSHQWQSVFGNPLRKSRIRPIASHAHSPASESATEGIPQCAVPQEIPTTTQQGNRQAESLPALYKTLEKSFREANDQAGVNEAWYLGTIAHRDAQGNTAQETKSSHIWTTLSWLGGDIPSRYTVDVWRTVWVSIGIMLVFYVLYLLVFWRSARSSNPDHWMVHISGHSERQRAFRLRLFEPIHSTAVVQKRMIIPWRDAAMLSIRAYLKLGLGTRYPNTQPLKTLMYFEWALGIFMLIHFILAMKNNLPFILPFLGVVN